MERVRKKEYKTQTMNKTQNNNIYIYLKQTQKHWGRGWLESTKELKEPTTTVKPNTEHMLSQTKPTTHDQHRTQSQHKKKYI